MPSTSISAGSLPPVPTAFASIDTLADYLVNGFWSSQGETPHHWANNTITVNFSDLTATERAIARSACLAWEDVCGIDFVETTGAANIIFTDDGTNEAFTSANWNGQLFTGAIVQISSDWSGGVGSPYFYQTYIHEIGHALGLGHQGPYNGSADYNTDAIFTNDTRRWSVMSYNEQDDAPFGDSFDFVFTPQMADIRAVQSIYGAASTRTGNTIYDFSNFSAVPALTIYDSGGTDTLDCSGFSMSQRINLNPGTWSSIGGFVNNVGIYLTVVIENVIGGSGNDAITGNAVSNTIAGGFGNDTVNGGLGTDTAIFSGLRSAYTLTAISGGGVRVAGPDGTDTLTSVERLVFSNQTVVWPQSSAAVSINDVTITEGNSGTKVATFTVTRTGGTAAFSVNFATANDSATAASDYVATSGTLSFASGVNSRTISVTIKGDTSVEANETFFVNLSGATSGATISDGQGRGAITNDDSGPAAGSLSINDVVITEGNSGTKVATFTVTRTGGTAAFSVNFATANNSATAASDYVATSGTLSFASGVNSRTISVTIKGDSAVEASETFFVNLSGATGGATIGDGQGQGSITNDETVAGPGSLLLDDVTITEGNSGTRIATFTVTRAGGTAAFAVNYATADNSATAGSDYGATAGTLSFASGVKSKTISVVVNGDTALEANETFLVNLSAATNGAIIVDSQGIGTITDDDNPTPFTEGSDTVELPVPNKTWHALGGNDNVVGTGGVDTVFGDGGNDIIRGGVDSDRLDGGAGDDVLNGGTGADVLTGGAGGDRYVVDSFDDVIVETAASGGSDVVFTTASYVLRLGLSVETLQSTNTSASVAPTLVGNELTNTIIGDLGNNVIDGGRGGDGLYGLAGHDIYIVDHAGDRVFEGANAGFDHVNSSVSFTLGANVESLTLVGNAAVNGTGNALSNTITGNDAANTLNGSANNDRLDGGAGNDALNGGKDTDFLVGGDGDDRYAVDIVGDQIIETAGGGTDAAYTTVSYVLGAGASVETLRSMNTVATTSITLVGNELSSTIIGDLGNNVIDGKGDADAMRGLAGDDVYIVDNAGDTVVEGANGGVDQINSAVSFVVGGHVETLTLTGTDAINGTGNTLSNTIFGNGAANVLDGGLGSDVLTGGAGADTFRFTTALGAGNRDVIADFSVIDDRIQLDNRVFVRLGSEAATLAPGQFFAGSAAHDADDRIIYDQTIGALIYDADGNGAAAAVEFARLAPNLLLTHADFQVI